MDLEKHYHFREITYFKNNLISLYRFVGQIFI